MVICKEDMPAKMAATLLEFVNRLLNHADFCATSSGRLNVIPNTNISGHGGVSSCGLRSGALWLAAFFVLTVSAFWFRFFQTWGKIVPTAEMMDCATGGLSARATLTGGQAARGKIHHSTRTLGPVVRYSPIQVRIWENLGSDK
jgi:hypothetical protein